ncbi:MAG: hypothetical protein KF812_02995 [Fimbriimonadaceae bacterium]|nr:hypothetical protein [Fimbriimonadaceae bacterium]
MLTTSLAATRLVHMEEWAGKHDVRVAPEIGAETLVVRGVSDDEIESFLPSLFDAEKNEGRWKRDDADAKAEWRAARQVAIQGAAMRRSPGTVETWASDLRASAFDRYGNPMVEGDNLSVKLMNAFLSTNQQGAADAAIQSPVREAPISVYSLPTDLSSATSTLLADLRRLPLGDSREESAFRKNFVWERNPDSVLITTQWYGHSLTMRVTFWGGDQYLGGAFASFLAPTVAESEVEKEASFLVPGTREQFHEMALDSKEPYGYLSKQIYPYEPRFIAVLSPQLEGELLSVWGVREVDADTAIRRSTSAGFGFKTNRTNDALVLRPSTWAAHAAYRFDVAALNEFAMGLATDVTHAPYIKIVRRIGTSYGRHPWLSNWRRESPGTATYGIQTDAEYSAWNSTGPVPIQVATEAARVFLLSELGEPDALSPSLQAVVRRGQLGTATVNFVREPTEVRRYLLPSGWTAWRRPVDWTRTSSVIANGQFREEVSSRVLGTITVSSTDQSVSNEPVILP